MKACGIVAEYNPLHTGHVYQMNKARQISQADCIIVVMSGNFVQRGEPAVIDKYARTSAALKAGADIVVELPVYYALSSAENFAKGAVLTLNTMKAASICFGAETDNADCLAKISRTIISESPEYKAILNKALAEGLSYPAARQTALLEYLPECKDIITGSNNILAIEYIKAILYNNLNMTYYPVLAKVLFEVAVKLQKETGVHIQRTFIQSAQDVCLEGVLCGFLADLVTVCRVAVADNVFQFMYRRTFSPFNFIEIMSFNDRIIETFLLTGCQTDLSQHFIYGFFTVFFGPYRFSVPIVFLRVRMVDVYHTQVDDVPMSQRLFTVSQFTGLVSGTHHATILGNYITRPDGQ